MRIPCSPFQQLVVNVFVVNVFVVSLNIGLFFRFVMNVTEIDHCVQSCDFMYVYVCVCVCSDACTHAHACHV